MALVVKNPPANAGDGRDTGLIPGSGRSPGGGRVNPLQYSYLENPMDVGAWWGYSPWVAKSRTLLSDFTSLSLDEYLIFTLKTGGKPAKK